MVRLLWVWLLVFLVGSVVLVPAATARPAAPSANTAGVAAYWGEERRAQAIPRDIVIDERGLSYLRGHGGTPQPFGHDVPAVVRAAPARPTGGQAPAARPGGGNSDTIPPKIEDMDPAEGQVIGSAYTFKAKVTDEGSGVKSVSFTIVYPDGRKQSYSASHSGSNIWSVSFSGFWDGDWRWQVVAKDNATRGGNTATSSEVRFEVDTTGGGGGGGGSEGVVTNAQWTGGGQVQTSAGRIYFELPSNKAQTRWSGYVCSGSVVKDSAPTSSLILTAAHCIYDDANKVFARNVLFIPDQAGTSASGTDRNCANDPIGCWAPTYGVVDGDWAIRTWPDNIPWDYGFYVVPTSGAHTPGLDDSSESLEEAAGTLEVSFEAPAVGVYTHAFGYSYSEDPKLMYCAENMVREGEHNWWLSQCGLSGGSSGGPWMQPFTASTGSGPVISVNSWGYRGSPGMAGPLLSGTSAKCLYDAAHTGQTSESRGFIPSHC